MASILSMPDICASLETEPGDPKNGWIWLMLFSTQIPSVANLCIAAAALFRGLPTVSAWLLAKLPLDRTVREGDRLQVACLMAGQVVFGPLATLLLFYLLFVWVIAPGLPLFATFLRDNTHAFASPDSPPAWLLWLLHR